MIPIQNIYYLLSYAFRILQEKGYRDLGREEFRNTADLCAAIICKTLRVQLKQGLGKEYIICSDELSAVRGKIDVNDTLKKLLINQGKLVCSFDDYSIDNKLNRIVKSTMELLLCAGVEPARKKELRKLLVFLKDVGSVDLRSVDWHINYNRNNQTYRLLISISYLVVKGLLQSEERGGNKLMDFFDDQSMSRLYERFLLEYYRKEHQGTVTAKASKVDWIEDRGFTEMLLEMKTDVTLSRGDRTLIIDAKYYGHTIQRHFDNDSIHSGNLYQIFTYVKNYDRTNSNNVSGMLLYAKTDEEIYPDHEYYMSGNKIIVRTLDLNKPFDQIREELDTIVEKV